MRLHRAPKVVSGNLTVLKPMKEPAVIIPTRGRSPECSTGRGAFSRTEPRGITRFGGRFPARAIIENLGFTGGNNVGIDYALHRRAPADYVFLLNNDAVLDKECLSVLVRVDREADAGVVGAVVTDHTGAILFARSATIFKHFFHVLLGGQPVPETRGEFWESLW